MDMDITYSCKNCGEKFKVREYVKLEVVHTYDDTNTLIILGRKCGSCGKTISMDDKAVCI
jgi:predicted RNA-binding Zn-ribbon protein involved in translation (DUF1610 family)